MSADKLVDSTQLDADLTSVANAIRTKGGTSAALAFPADFVSAIAAIPSGGGDPNENLKKWAEGTLATVDLTGATTIIAHFRYIQDGNTFTVFAPDAITINGYAFAQSIKLTAIYCPVVQSVGTQAFYNTRLTTFVAPEYPNSNDLSTNAFAGSSSLTVVDVGSPRSIAASCFNGCSALNTLIIRGTEVTKLGNINAFNGTPFASGGTGGTIYIPKDLYDHLGDGTSRDYKAATNWSTVDGYGTITWAKIEGSIYETQYADGTPIA